jgi:hypothetical protein
MRLLFPVAVLLLASADTAAAHNVSEDGATGVTSNARSTVVTDDLPPGVTFEMLQNGLAVRLHNGSSALVVVREPRLRITPGQFRAVAPRRRVSLPRPAGAAVAGCRLLVVAGMHGQSISVSPGPLPTPHKRADRNP